MNNNNNNNNRNGNMPKGNPYFSNRYVRNIPLSEKVEHREKMMNMAQGRPQVTPPPRPIRPPMPIIPPEMRGKHESKGRIVSAGNVVSPLPVAPKRPAVKHDQETTLASYENNKNMALFKAIIAILFLFILSTGLSFVRFKLPFLPSFLEVDFSIVPEFICVVFFGPLIGSGVVLFKNLAHMGLYTIIYSSPSYVSELSNVTTDLLFIVFAFIFYRLAINNEAPEFVKKGKRIRAVLFGGFVSSLITSVIILPFDYYLIYPLFIKYFQHFGIELNIMAYYLEKMPTLDSMWQGLLMFNFPWEFGKLFAVTVIATVCYFIGTIKE